MKEKVCTCSTDDGALDRICQVCNPIEYYQAEQEKKRQRPVENG